jgi:hypothetical protein
LQGRHKRKHHAAAERDGESEAQQRKTQLGGEPRSGGILRQEAQQAGDAPLSYQQSKSAARHSHHQPFGQQLAQEARAAGSQRQTDGDFALPSGGPGQHEVGHVGAGDQQHQPHHRHEHLQRFAEPLAEAVDALRGRFELRFRLQKLIALAGVLQVFGARQILLPEWRGK